MNLVPEFWTCQNCHTQYTDKKDIPFQVDYINDTHFLCSSYFEQWYVKKFNNNGPQLNECYCRQCLIQQEGNIKMIFDKEPEYTFQQNGFTCWNIEMLDDYKRGCGVCCGCQVPQILPSQLKVNHINQVMLLWSPYLCTLSFPDAMTPKVYTLSEQSQFFNTHDKPLILCINCFNQEKWIPYKDPIRCQFCHHSSPRWINSYDCKPKYLGISVCCHQHIEEGVIYDGIIDPLSYSWINKPNHFDETKPFCEDCLQQFVNDKILECDWESCSDDF